MFRGLQLAARTEDRFGKVLALGLSLTFAFSVFINMGVVMGLLPTKGLTLPFLSYGGSSFMMMGLMFGLLLNVERTERGAIPGGSPIGTFDANGCVHCALRLRGACSWIKSATGVVIIAGGGTGGHIYPGVAIARAVEKMYPGVKVHFVGCDGRS